MDPIETWHDAPEFERMEKRIRDLEAKHYDSVKQFYELAAEHSQLVIKYERAKERIKQLEKGYDELRKINNRLKARLTKATK